MQIVIVIRQDIENLEEGNEVYKEVQDALEDKPKLAFTANITNQLEPQEKET